MKVYQRIVSIIIFAGILATTQLFANTSTTLSINGESVEVPANLSIREGLIPLRWMAQTMGASNISWDKGTVTIEIDSFLERYKYLDYLSGLKIKNEYDYKSLGEATVLETKKLDDHIASYEIKYNEMLQGKVWHQMKQKIIVEKQLGLKSEKWVITRIENNNPYYSVLPCELYH